MHDRRCCALAHGVSYATLKLSKAVASSAGYVHDTSRFRRKGPKHFTSYTYSVDRLQRRTRSSRVITPRGVEEGSMDQAVTAARLGRTHDGFERQHINGCVTLRPRRLSARGRAPSTLVEPPQAIDMTRTTHFTVRRTRSPAGRAPTG